MVSANAHGDTPATQQGRPNFLIIGSGESGTSWLYACLLQHPEVFLPTEMRPEPHFFYKSWEYKKGVDYYLERWFSNVPSNAIAIGERSSSYIFGSEVPSRIKEHFPDIKLILMLRDPVDRALSNWRFTVESGLETLSFEQAVACEKERLAAEHDPVWREIQPFAYIGRSTYGEQVERFLKFFSRDQLLILNSDRVRVDEQAALQRIQGFLGLTEIEDLQSEGTFPTSSVRSRRLQRWLRHKLGGQFDYAIESTRRPGAQSETVGPVLRSLLKWNLTKKHKPISPTLKETLRRQFHSSNLQLAPHVDWDPMHWKGHA